MHLRSTCGIQLFLICISSCTVTTIFTWPPLFFLLLSLIFIPPSITFCFYSSLCLFYFLLLRAYFVHYALQKHHRLFLCVWLHGPVNRSWLVLWQCKICVCVCLYPQGEQATDKLVCDTRPSCVPPSNILVSIMGFQVIGLFVSVCSWEMIVFIQHFAEIRWDLSEWKLHLKWLWNVLFNTKFMEMSVLASFAPLLSGSVLS